MYELAFFNDKQHRQTKVRPGSVLIGSDPLADSRCQQIQVDDPWIEKEQTLITFHEDGECEVFNLGSSLVVPGGRRVRGDRKLKLQVPFEFSIGQTRFSIKNSKTENPFDSTLRKICPLAKTLDIFQMAEGCSGLESDLQQTPPAAETLIHWFDALNGLQRSSAGSTEFYQKAVQCLIDPGGMDFSLLLNLRENQWEIIASRVQFPECGFTFRRDLVEKVAAEKTLWYHHADMLNEGPYENQQWIVASPVLDKDDKVSGVLYGGRIESEGNRRHGIRPLEAHFVRLVSDSINAANKRINAQAEAARTQVLLEQTFTPNVVKILRRDPNLLQSREAEVSVMFIDLRRFSTISESIGSQKTHQILADIFNRFTAIVEENEGVIIDYFGDGLAAFWNAPVNIEDHPFKACQAAIQLQDMMSDLNRDWESSIPFPLEIGIGIHTGKAEVGNSGCDRKVKYGPRGNTVNLACRLESATKHFRLPILLSSDTASRVSDRMLTLRLCETHLPGIQQTVNVFQLVGRELSVQQLEFNQKYQACLEELESGNLPNLMELLLDFYNESDYDPRIDFLICQLEDRMKESGQIDSFPKSLHRISKFGEEITDRPKKECYKAIVQSS